MALQTTGSISISQIKSQLGSSYNSLSQLFGAADALKFVNGNKTAPHSMSEFYGYPKAISGVTYVSAYVYWPEDPGALSISEGMSYKIGTGNQIYLTEFENRNLFIPSSDTIHVYASAIFDVNNRRIILRAGSGLGSNNYGQVTGNGLTGQQNVNLSVSLSGKSVVYFTATIEAF
jgi:hypothetical protein